MSILCLKPINGVLPLRVKHSPSKDLRTLPAICPLLPHPLDFIFYCLLPPSFSLCSSNLVRILLPQAFTIHFPLYVECSFHRYLQGLLPLLLQKMKMLVAQSCQTLCDPMVCSLPGSSVHGILQAKILEGVAMSFSRGSSQSRD